MEDRRSSTKSVKSRDTIGTVWTVIGIVGTAIETTGETMEMMMKIIGTMRMTTETIEMRGGPLEGQGNRPGFLCPSKCFSSYDRALYIYLNLLH